MDLKEFIRYLIVLLTATITKADPAIENSLSAKNFLVSRKDQDTILLRNSFLKSFPNFNFSMPTNFFSPKKNEAIGNTTSEATADSDESSTPCTCAVFMTGQFKKGSSEQPKGLPAIVQELDTVYPCSRKGIKTCTNKCLHLVTKHLSNAATIICNAIERDCRKERAYLFVKNCQDKWVNSNLSAGREFCCKDGEPYKCPLI